MGGLTSAPCVAISLSRTPRFLHPKTAHKNQAMRCDLVNLKIDLNYVFHPHPLNVLFFGGGTLNVSYIFVGDLGGP